MLHSLCDYVLRYRVESIVNFSSEFVREVQVDQKKRYAELKESSLPSAIIAKKTREFRCTARDQMLALVNYKSPDNASLDLAEEIKSKLQDFHSKINTVAQIKERPDEEVNKDDSENSKSALAKVFKILFLPENSETNGDMSLSGDSLVKPEPDSGMHSIEGSAESLDPYKVEKHHSKLTFTIIELFD